MLLGREHAGVIRPGSRGLVLHTLFFASEVWLQEESPADLGLVDEKELELAKMLVPSGGGWVSSPPGGTAFRRSGLSHPDRCLAARLEMEGAPYPASSGLKERMHVVEISIGTSARKTEISVDGVPLRSSAMALTLASDDTPAPGAARRGPPQALAEVVEPGIIERCARAADDVGASPGSCNAQNETGLLQRKSFNSIAVWLPRGHPRKPFPD